MVIDRENGRGVPPDRGVLITIVTSTLPSPSVASYMVELNPTVINPRRACARVTVVVLSVCLSVYPSVPALAASASVETSKQRYSRVSLRLFLD